MINPKILILDDSTSAVDVATEARIQEIGRARYEAVTDDEVVEAFTLLSRTEGIIPALEPAHAIAWMSRDRAALAGRTVLVCLSGRGDKDVAQMMEVLGADMSTGRGR